MLRSTQNNTVIAVFRFPPSSPYASAHVRVVKAYEGRHRSEPLVCQSLYHLRTCSARCTNQT